MEIKKIESSTIVKTNPTQESQIKSPQMFSAEFNKEEGLEVEKQTTQQNEKETYTKISKDESGNETILTYRSRDNALIQREIKYGYSYTKTEFIKPGTTIVQSSMEKDSEGNILTISNYYETSPFGIKELKEYNVTTGNVASISLYENGSDKATSKTIYDNKYTTVMSLLNGEPEETTIYRKDGSIEQKITPQIIEGEKRYQSSTFREDGTLYSSGTYADSFATFPIDETVYSFDGKTIDAKEYTVNSSNVHRERYDEKGNIRVKEIYDRSGRTLEERIIYDKKGEAFIHTKYGANREITYYEKNENSVANLPFKEKLLDGKIDTSFKQGLAGTCYIASTIRSLLETETGRQVLANSIKYDETSGTSTIMFHGVQKEYSFTKEEIEKAMGRLGTGDPDFTAFLLGYEKYRTEELKRTVDGGLGTEVFTALLGSPGETNILFGSICDTITNETLDKLQKDMETNEMAITVATPPKDVRTEFNEKENKMGLLNSHAYAIKKITNNSVVLVEPGKDKEIKISRETFLKNFILYFAHNLNEI